MQYLEYINEFIEGRLTHEQEDMLFSQMARDPGLRRDFKQFMDFDRMPEHDSSAYYAPEELETAVFRSLNIAPAANIALTGILSGLWAKYSQAFIATMSTAALAGCLIICGLFDQSNTDIAPVISHFVSGINQADNNNKFTEHVSTAVKNNISPAPIAANNEPQAQGSQDIIPELAQSEGASATAIVNSILLSQVTDSDDKDGCLTLSKLEWPDNQEYNLSELESDNNKDDDLFDQLSVEVRGARYYAQNQNRVARSSDPPFENMSVTLWYELDKDWQIGLNARQEFYYLEYSGWVNNEHNFIRQHTNFAAVNLMLRYNWLRYKGIVAYSELGAGAIETGPVGRLALGLEYRPSLNYSMGVGAEGSLAGFGQGNIYYCAEKLGLYYGLKLNL